MNKFEELRELYKIKKEKNECTKEQITFLDTYLNDEYCFLRTKEQEALKIIYFLGIPKDKVYRYYQEILIAMLKKMKSDKNSNAK